MAKEYPLVPDGGSLSSFSINCKAFIMESTRLPTKEATINCYITEGTIENEWTQGNRVIEETGGNEGTKGTGGTKWAKGSVGT